MPSTAIYSVSFTPMNPNTVLSDCGQSLQLRMVLQNKRHLLLECEVLLPSNKPTGPFSVYLNVLPAIAKLSKYAFTTGG